MSSTTLWPEFVGFNMVDFSKAYPGASLAITTVGVVPRLSLAIARASPELKRHCPEK